MTLGRMTLGRKTLGRMPLGRMPLGRMTGNYLPQNNPFFSVSKLAELQFIELTLPNTFF
jgi:hypothetical protein